MGRQNKSGGIYVWTHLFKIFYDRACIFVYIYIDIFNNLNETLQSIMSALIFVMVTIFFGRELHEFILNNEKCNCFCYITIAEQCSIKI